MRSIVAAGVLASLLSACSTPYRAATGDLARLPELQDRDGTLPATSFEDGEAERIALRANAILKVGPDYGNGLRRVEARDGRTPLLVGLVGLAIGGFATLGVASTHPEDEFLGEVQYVPTVALMVAGGVTALVGAALGNPEADEVRPAP